MPVFFASTLFKYAIVPALIALVLSGGYAIITTRAFNRGHDAGVAEVTKQMEAKIAEEAHAAAKRVADLRRMSPTEVDAEITRLCIAAEKAKGRDGKQCG